MSANSEQRKLAAIMFTDMVGYSALAQRDDKLALELLEEHRQLLREIFPRFNGTEIKTIGDAFLIEFSSALAAAQCAIEIQRTLAKRNHDVTADRRIELKIGIHIGDVVHRGGDVYGDGVNIASRIEPLAGAGGICVSMDVERQIRNALEARLEKLAPTELKNISVAMDLFRIVLPWERAKTELENARPRGHSFPASRLVWIGAIVLAAVGAAWWFAHQFLPTKNAPTPRRSEAATDLAAQKSIAVLPFENLSEDKANAYFCEGVQDEILTKLASIADLKVISRTSTAKYKSKPEDLKTVSQQLGVATVLEGSVQKAGDKVRVNVQLIDARADSHLWAKTYDRDLADVFAIQTEVAQEIADSLQAKLSPAEANTVARAPTENTEAYDFFLKGEFEEREAESSLKPEVYDQAASWYRRAIAQDPKFALAIARFVNSRMQRHWFVEPLSEKELEELRQTAQDAVKLAPTLAEAHVSLGIVYYFGHRQYDEALGEFRRAIELQPNNARALEYSGYVHRRQGRWQECLSELSKAEEQDPREAGVPGNFSTSHTQLRMWKEAERYAARSLALNPHTVDGMRALLISYLNGRGDFKGARRLLETFPPDANLLADAAHMTVEGPLGLRAYVSVLEGNYAAALQLFENQSNGLGENARLSARGTVHILAGDAAGVRGEMEKARRLVEARLQERPSDLDSMIQLSWIYLGLDRKSDALKLAQRAADFLPPEKDALVGTFTLYNVAAIKARTGDATGAIDILRRLLAMPAGHEVSVISLKTNPVWAPIRNDPGFQELLTGKELVGPSEQLR